MTSQVIEQAADAATAIANATVYPWIVLTGYMLDLTCGGWRYEHTINVVWATAAQAPEAETFLPEGATFCRGEVFPASRLEDMPEQSRSLFVQHYKAWLIARKARALSKSVADLRQWTDFDPIHIEETALRWARPGVRYTGD